MRRRWQGQVRILVGDAPQPQKSERGAAGVPAIAGHLRAFDSTRKRSHMPVARGRAQPRRSVHQLCRSRRQICPASFLVNTQPASMYRDGHPPKIFLMRLRRKDPTGSKRLVEKSLCLSRRRWGKIFLTASLTAVFFLVSSCFRRRIPMAFKVATREIAS